MAYLAARPQVFDEALVPRGLVGEVELVNELLGVLADIAAQLDCGVSLAGVAAKDDELAAVEEVGQLLRIHFAERDALADVELEVGEDGIADLGVQAAD